MSRVFNLAEELEKERKKNKELEERIDKATEELFVLKDMIAILNRREEHFPIQRKISSIIKMINGKGSDNNGNDNNK